MAGMVGFMRLSTTGETDDSMTEHFKFAPAAGAVPDQPVDGAWSLAAHVIDAAPELLGYVMLLCVIGGIGYAAIKLGPPVIRMMALSTDAIASSAAAFESMEAHVTDAISKNTNSLRRVGTWIKAFHERLEAVEKAIQDKDSKS